MVSIKKGASQTGPSNSPAGQQAIGKVVVLQGHVQAAAADGSVRTLFPDSAVYANDRIITGEDGSLSLSISGRPSISLNIDRAADIVLDEDVYAPLRVTPPADAAAEAFSIREALLRSEDSTPVKVPEADSAGGGHYIVHFDLTANEVTPTSGAETVGINHTTVETIESDVVDVPAESGISEDGIISPIFTIFNFGAGLHVEEGRLHVLDGQGNALIKGTKHGENSDPDGYVISQTGSFTVTESQLAALTVTNGNGQAVTVTDGQIVHSDHGFLTLAVSGSAGGPYTVSYTFTLTENHASHPENAHTAGPYGNYNESASADKFEFLMNNQSVPGGTLWINIKDDGISAYTETSVAVSDFHNATSDSIDMPYGADGPILVQKIAIGTTEIELVAVDSTTGLRGADNGPQSVSVNAKGEVCDSTASDCIGTFTFKSDGSYAFTPHQSICEQAYGQIDFKFALTFMDADGDTRKSADGLTFTFDFTDIPAPTVGITNAGIVVSEVWLTDGTQRQGAPHGVDDFGVITVTKDSRLNLNDVTFKYTDLDGNDYAVTVGYTGGVITVVAADGVTAVDPADPVFTVYSGDGVPLGTITITSFDPVTGAVGYTFTLTGVLDNPKGVDAGDGVLSGSYILEDLLGKLGLTVECTFVDVLYGNTYVFKDVGGDPVIVAADFTVTVHDDVPLADDDNFVVPGGENTVNGNVLANDMYGADGEPATNAFAWGSLAVVLDDDGGTVALTIDHGGVLTGTDGKNYGTLILSSDGSGDFRYTKPTGNPFSGTIKVGYTITDGDGDTETATLGISVASSGITIVPGDPDNPSMNGLTVNVYEKYLTGGTGESDAGATLVSTGVFTISAPEGFAGAWIGSVLVIDTDGILTGTQITTTDGFLKVTGYDPSTGKVTYEYHLSRNTVDHTGTNVNSLDHSFTLTVKDDAGNEKSAVITATVVDDKPIANATDGIYENAAGVEMTGRLGEFGADNPSVVSSVVFDLSKAQWLYNDQPVQWMYNDHPVVIKYGATQNIVEGWSHNNATKVFTLTADPQTGEYTFQLHAPLQIETTKTEIIGSLDANQAIPNGQNPALWLHTVNGLVNVAPADGNWTMKFELFRTSNGAVQTIGSSNGIFGTSSGTINQNQSQTCTMVITPYTNLVYVDGVLSDTSKYAGQLTIGLGIGGTNPPTDASLLTTATVKYVSLTNPSDIINNVTFTNAGHLATIEVASREGYYIESVRITTLDPKVGMTGVALYSVVHLTEAIDLTGLEIPYVLTDGDGDTVAGSLILRPSPSGNITAPGNEGYLLAAAGIQDYLLIGGGGDDIIYGSIGNDIIFGGRGGDVMYGGGGNGVFGWGTADYDHGAIDKVMDFTLGSDRLSFAGIFGNDARTSIDRSDIENALSAGKITLTAENARLLTITVNYEGKVQTVEVHLVNPLSPDHIAVINGSDLGKAAFLEGVLTDLGVDYLNKIVDAPDIDGVLQGTAGADILVGLSGDDTLFADNTMFGGKGADTFVIGKYSNNTMKDYSLVEGDRLDITDVIDSGSYEWDIADDGSGKLKLSLQDSNGTEKASVTFENINYSNDMNIDYILSNLIRVDDGMP